MTARQIHKGLTVFSGIRPADDCHPGRWPAVGIDPDDADDPSVVLEAMAAGAAGVALVKASAEAPDALFDPEFLAMPEGGGMTAESARGLGLQLIVSATRAACEFAIWEILNKRGWTDTDMHRFISDVATRLEENRIPSI